MPSKHDDISTGQYFITMQKQSHQKIHQITSSCFILEAIMNPKPNQNLLID